MTILGQHYMLVGVLVFGACFYGAGLLFCKLIGFIQAQGLEFLGDLRLVLSFFDFDGCGKFCGWFL